MLRGESAEPWVYGLITGTVKTYYAPEKLKSAIDFKSDRKHGKYIIYYENGNMEWNGTYTANRKTGEWIHYNRGGVPDKKEIYQNDKLIKELKLQ